MHELDAMLRYGWMAVQNEISAGPRNKQYNYKNREMNCSSFADEVLAMLYCNIAHCALVKSTLLKHLYIKLPLIFPRISYASVGTTRSGNNLDICTRSVNFADTSSPSKVGSDVV
eukprot:scaffold3828_cov110-Skeletonema_dohrnii-CCMP3373.AAC.8